MYICSMTSWSWHTGWWHWWTRFSPSPTTFPSKSAWSWVGHLILSILLHSRQNLHLFLCCCYILFTQQFVWDRWHASWAHPRCYLLEVQQTSTWLCFHQHWQTWTRYVWIECCSSQALLFRHCETCQVLLCTCSLVFSSWGFPKWEHRHVGYRVWYSGQWEASNFGDSFRFHSMFSSFITYLWGWASPKRLEVYGLSRYIWRILC